MARRRGLRELVLVAVVLGGCLPGAVAAVDVGGADSDDRGVAPTVGVPESSRDRTGGSLTARPPEVDTTTTRIRVHANGSATWVVEIRTRITNDTDLEDYRRFQAAFRNDTDRYLGPYRDHMTGLVAAAANVTGRAMTARGFAASTRVQTSPRQWGIVEYRFLWVGFARTDGDAILVGDVFESGYYLTDGDSLVVEAPDGYRVTDPRPAPRRRDASTARWVGPIDFADRRPAVRLVPDRETTTGGTRTTRADATTGNAGGTTPVGSDGSSGGGRLPLLAGAVLAAVLVAGGYVVLTRTDVGDGPTGDAPDAEAVEGSDGPEEATAPDADHGADATGDDPTAGPKDADGDGTAAAGVDDDLVTNEEQVIALLEANGGRMRQADVADELDWSAPKTSRVLSGMADEGAIEKLRLGNENIIDLPDGGD